MAENQTSDNNSDKTPQAGMPNPNAITDYARLEAIQKKPIALTPEVQAVLKDIKKSLDKVEENTGKSVNQGDSTVYTDESNAPSTTPSKEEKPIEPTDASQEEQKKEGFSPGMMGVIGGAIAALIAGLSSERGRRLAWGIFQPLFEWIWEQLKKMLDWIWDGIVGLWDKFMEWLKGIWQIVWNWLQGFYNNYIGPWLGPILATIKKATDWIDSKLGISSGLDKIFNGGVDPDTGKDAGFFERFNPFGNSVSKSEWEKQHPELAQMRREEEEEDKIGDDDYRDGDKPIDSARSSDKEEANKAEMAKLLAQYNALVKAGIDRTNALAMASLSVKESKETGKELTLIPEKLASAFEKYLKDSKLERSSDVEAKYLKDRHSDSMIKNTVAGTPTKDQVMMASAIFSKSMYGESKLSKEDLQSIEKLVSAAGVETSKAITTSTVDKNNVSLTSTVSQPALPTVTSKLTQSAVQVRDSQVSKDKISVAKLTPASLETPSEQINKNNSNSSNKQQTESVTNNKTTIVQGNELNSINLKKN